MTTFTSRDMIITFISRTVTAGLYPITRIAKSRRRPFNLDNVNYFNLFYKDKLINIALIIKYINKSIFFYNIYIYIN